MTYEEYKRKKQNGSSQVEQDADALTPYQKYRAEKGLSLEPAFNAGAQVPVGQITASQKDTTVELPGIVTGYDPVKNRAEGQAGWKDYIETQERHSQQAAAAEKGEKKKAFWDYLAMMGEGRDTTLPFHTDTNAIAESYHKQPLFDLYGIVPLTFESVHVDLTLRARLGQHGKMIVAVPIQAYRHTVVGACKYRIRIDAVEVFQFFFGRYNARRQRQHFVLHREHAFDRLIQRFIRNDAFVVALTHPLYHLLVIAVERQCHRTCVTDR